MRPRKFVSLWLVVLLSMLILSACNSPATNTTSVSSTSAQTTVTPVTLPPETKPTTSPTTKHAGMSPGTYLGLGNGRNGAIVVKVQVSENSLDSIDVVSSQETWNTGSIPISVYPDQILKTQSLDVDLISGATISSLALLNAVKDAISQAGGDPAKFTGKIPAPPAPQNA
ncbi:FMN-binding protein [Clostridiaceae bacterium HFYG-1003]|nr:FMN-binding protein [Clostridiaceae bacterium HFYG-1003]